MKIGELAKRLGVAPSKIRFLEANGLVQPPDRRQSGYRDYDESAVERLEIILQAQSFGFTLDEIRSAFAETEGGDLRCDYLIKKLTAKLQDVDRHIEQIRALRVRLLEAIHELEARRAANGQDGISQSGKHELRLCHGETPHWPPAVENSGAFNS